MTKEEINTTEELMEELVKFGAIYAFRYCILNGLDFSTGSEYDDTVVATELYDEMWADENNMATIKNEFTKIFKKIKI